MPKFLGTRNPDGTGDENVALVDRHGRLHVRPDTENTIDNPHQQVVELLCEILYELKQFRLAFSAVLDDFPFTNEDNPDAS